MPVSTTAYYRDIPLDLEYLPGNYVEIGKVPQVVSKYRLTSVRRGTAPPRRIRRKLAADFAHCLIAYAANPTELSSEYL